MSTQRIRPIFVGVGHGRLPDGRYDPGAVGPDGFVEHRKAHAVARHVARALERSNVAYVSESDAGPGHDPNWVGSARKANEVAACRAIEIHLNAGGGSGPEVLYVSSAGEGFARRCSRALAAALGLPNRGAKHRTDLGFLNSTRMPAALIEVCFVDHARDRRAFDARAAGEAIARELCRWIGRRYVAPKRPRRAA